MPNREQKVENFIDEVPDSKLTGLPTQTGKNLYKNNDFRLDMQNMTSDDPSKHNLHVQVNKKPKTTSLSQYAPNTVAQAQVPGGENELTAQQVRDALKAGIDFSLATR